ncbi:MAG: primosomal protein N' [Bacilli bacterium]
MLMVVEVLVEIKAKRIDKTFTYSVPANLVAEIAIGKRVLVPFNNRMLEGFVLKINDNNESYDYELKEIVSVVDKYPVLNNELIKLGKYISEKTLSTLIAAYQTMLPTALNAKKGLVVNKKYEKYLTLSDSLNIDSITNPKQKEIIEMLKKNNRCLKKDCINVSVYGVKTLLEKGFIVEELEEVYRLNNDSVKKKSNITLNKDQILAIDKVKSSIDQFQPFLLHGVTGSGKTEVYMSIIEYVLEIGKEAIVLVPEISLTPQMVENFRNRFGSKIAIIHSRLSNGEKYDEWRKIEKEEVSIVIGARSAIFAPFKNIGVIIIDEEHSTTYKQENTPKYNTIDVAIKRAKTHKCPVVLGSATPLIESYTRAKLGIYELLELKKRVNDNPPKVYLIDMKDEIKQGHRILSRVLVDNIKNTLERGEQVIILLNRRGYSTVVTCHSCGFTVKCPNCDIPLIYHKTTNNLRCHYCDYTTYKVKNCSSCHSEDINQFGLGTEKLEEEINKLFLNAKVIRMDFDTTSRKGSHERIIADFRNEKYNILIGTQMIAKGLDFEKVTLVGVLNGDASLNIPDFRSAERTFQLLNQVSGRAGRGNYPGKVIIQTFNQDHYSIIYAINDNYVGFYEQEMNIRKKLGYPPFYNLALIKISSNDYELANKESKKIIKFLEAKVYKNVILLGPSASSMPKINNIYYLQIVIKYKTSNSLIPLLEEINKRYNSNNKISVDIDVNPIKL